MVVPILKYPSNLLYEPHFSSLATRPPLFIDSLLCIKPSHLHRTFPFTPSKWMSLMDPVSFPFPLAQVRRSQRPAMPHCPLLLFSPLLDYSSQDTTTNRAELWAQWRRLKAHIKALRRCGFKLDTPRNLWEEVD